MSLPISRLVQAATARGLNSTTPVLLTMDGPLAVRINVVVSQAEPINYAAPLDLIWIEPVSQVALRRVNRQQSSGYVHTWTPVTEANSWTAQTWDEPIPTTQPLKELNAQVGNPFFLTADDIHALDTRTGGSIEGPLHVVTKSVDDYAPTEVMPKSVVKSLTDAAAGVAASVYQQLASVRSAATALRTRVTNVEKRVTTLEQNPPGGQSLPIKQYTQEVPELEWIIEHNLDTKSFVVNVYLPTGEVMVPEVAAAVDSSTFRLLFAAPRAGTATLIGIKA